MIALFVASAILAACAGSTTELYNPFTPVPAFGWIKDGAPRPTPHIAETKVGIEPSRFLGEENGIQSYGPSEDDCYESEDRDGCLRRNWLAMLKTFNEDELGKAGEGRSYRFLYFPSFSPWLSVRLDVLANGGGTLIASWAEPGKDRRWTRVGTVKSALSAADVAALNQRIGASSFERVVPDPSTLPGVNGCLDGSNSIFEAHAEGRYRYVARHICEPDGPQIRDLGVSLIRLAQRTSPEIPFREE